MIFSNLFLTSKYKKIVLSKGRAEAFINHNPLGYEIKSVAIDDMCILHSFVEIGKKVTLS